MDFKDLLEKRYSVRKFSDQKVTKELIDQLMKMAMTCPTSRNDQPQRVMILEGEKDLERLKLSLKQDYGAPMYVIICYDERDSRIRSFKDINGGTVSASIFASYLMLSAFNEGLACTWVGAFDLEKFATSFELEHYMIPIGALAIGYPDDTSKPSKEHFERKSISEIIID